MEADVIQALAGPAAEARYRRVDSIVALFGGGSDDWEHAKRKARDFASDEAELAHILDRFYNKAAKLVREPGHWQAIATLADKLLERGTLEATDAVQIIESAFTGECIDRELAGETQPEPTERPRGTAYRPRKRKRS